MSKPWAIFLIFTFLYTQAALAQPPVRRFDDPGSPPFNVLKAGENPPLDVDGNFVIGPEYTPVPERKAVEGVPQGKVKQFTIDSKETKLFNPGIARKVFGKVDPRPNARFQEPCALPLCGAMPTALRGQATPVTRIQPQECHAWHAAFSIRRFIDQ
jgi:hypothetical protein